jgi:hypothetical protein
MTNDERKRLRELCNEYVEWWSKRYPKTTTDDDIRLDEDSCQSLTTEAELLVFDIPRDDLHKLYSLYQIYMRFIDITSSHSLSDELAALIVKARDICPPATFYGQAFPFKTGHDEWQYFQWFGKEFFGLRKRVTMAFWHKLYYNHDGLTSYDDDPPEKPRERPKVVRLDPRPLGKQPIDEDDLPF